MDLITYALCRKLIKRSIESLGDVFTLKGNVDSVGNLPSTGNKTGDVYLVGPDLEGSYDEYYWTSENEWETMGATGPGFEHAITEEVMYKGTDGTGTIENPAQDTIMYVINNNINNMNNIYEGYYYNNKFYEDANHTIEIIGESEKFYVDLSTNTIYRWDNTEYIEVTGDSVKLEIKEPNDFNLEENSINYYPEAYSSEINSNPRLKYLLSSDKIANSTNGNGYTWEEYNNIFVWNNFEEISNMIENKIISKYNVYNFNQIASQVEEYYLNVPEMLNQNWPNQDYEDISEGQFNFLYDIIPDGSIHNYKTLYYIDGNFYSCTFCFLGGYETGYYPRIEDISLIDPSLVEQGTRLEYLINHPEMIMLSQSINGEEEIIKEERFEPLIKSWFNNFNEDAFSALQSSNLWELIALNEWDKNNAETDLTYNNDNWNYLINTNLAMLPYNNNLYLLYFLNGPLYAELDKIEKIISNSNNAYLILKKNNNEYEFGPQYVRKTGDTMTGNLNIVGNSALTVGYRNPSSSTGIYSFAQGSNLAAEGRYSHAEGLNTIAIGENSHAEGNNTTALGKNSHVEGKGSNSYLIELQEDKTVSGTYWVKNGVINSNGGWIARDNSLYKIRSVGTGIFNEENTQYITLWVYGAGNFTAWYSYTGALDENSHAEGNQTVASEKGAHAEGSFTTASDSSAHAEGYYTQATGSFSHAEGSYAIASGSGAHAEGYNTNATGGYGAHAEGYKTTASNEDAHAEGYGSLASGRDAHAEGGYYTSYTIQLTGDANTKVYTTSDTKKAKVGDLVIYNNITGRITNVVENTQITLDKTLDADSNLSNASCNLNPVTVASGWCSHAEGSMTWARGQQSHAEGIWTKAYIYSHAEGFSTQANGETSHSEGQETIASGYVSHAEGRETTTLGKYSHSEGAYTTASGRTSHAENYKTFASGENSHSEGFFTKASGNNSHSEGASATVEHTITGAKNATEYTISGQVEIGQYIIYYKDEFNYALCEILTTSYDDTQDLSTITVDTTLNSGSKLNNTSVLVFWPYSNLASGNNSHTEGQSTIASGIGSHAEGKSTMASGENSHAGGQNTIANGKNSHTEGDKTIALGDNSFAQGANIFSVGENSHAEGEGAWSYDYPILFTGAANTTTYTGARWHYSLDNNSWVYCPQTRMCAKIISAEETSSNLYTYTMSSTLNPNEAFSDVPVYQTGGGIAAAIGSHIEGYRCNVEEDGEYGHAEGFLTNVIDEAGHAEGEETKAGYYSHAEGYRSFADNRSHAEGRETIASGENSHAEGYCAVASGYASHAEGKETVSSGNYSHAEGATIDISSGIRLIGEGGAVTYTIGSSIAPGIKVGDFIKKDSNTQIKITNIGTDTITLEQTLSDTAINDKMYAVRCLSVASGDYSHAEGSGTFASGQTSHAEGKQTIASGENSHAEGLGTIASNTFSHAEGRYTEATGNNSHAEGYMTLAEGTISHAEGRGTKAMEDYSHAEGFSTIASGQAAHSEGINTTANTKSQHVQGEYNILDTTGTSTTRGTYAHIIGNGTGTSNRSNAYTLDWLGNAWYAGDIYTGSTSGTNKDSGSKKLATEEYVRNLLQEFATLNNLNMPD